MSQEIFSYNASIERYNQTVRYDWLNHYLFQDIEWLWTHNNERPNMALGGLNPRIYITGYSFIISTFDSIKNGGITIAAV